MGSSTVVISSADPQEAGTSKSELSIVDKIFHKLSDNEKEQAARASSYRYLVASTSPTGEGRENRNEYAKATIQRYVTVEQKLGKHKSPDVWEEYAHAKLIKTLQYREEKKVDDIRFCFDNDKQSDNEGEHAAIRERLEERFKDGASIVRGYTKDGRAMFQNIIRVEFAWDDEEYYIKGNIYMMERALACTERNTDGEKDKILVFYDYNGYSGLKNSPPPMLVKRLLTDLRDHWPERLQHTFIVDAPFAFRVFWSIIKHFIDPITKECVQFVTGEEQKEIFRELVSDDQAAPYMFRGGKDCEEADQKKFFYDIPFDRAHGEN